MLNFPPQRSSPIAQIAILVLTFGALLPVANAGERTLHVFTRNGNGTFWAGEQPNANLVADAAGNLYGTTQEGGKFGYGLVFELSPTGKGHWAEKVLHDFGSIPGDGLEPLSGLILDGAGNLYGTTIGGGGSSAGDGGTVYELSQGRDGNWREKILWSFAAYDGTSYFPRSGLVRDAAGNLFGSTIDPSGTFGKGTVFEVSPTSGGGWAGADIYNFGSSATDGLNPVSPYLTVDAGGNLYGVTFQGGAWGVGTVYELSPTAGGTWSESTIYSFTGGTDGSYPYSTLTQDSKGNFFGTTTQSSNGAGAAFEISPLAGGGWSEKTIYTFASPVGGQTVFLTMAIDGAGNLYGTSPVGGAHNWGSVFELSPRLSGSWNATVLYSFTQTDGATSRTGVIRDPYGNLYGLTLQGGDLTQCFSAGCGVVFEVTH